MRRFEVGDRVVVTCPYSAAKGTVCTVIGPLRKWDGVGHNGRTYYGHEVDIPVPSHGWAAFEPQHLKPVYDGHEPVSWSSCVWKPTGVEA